LPLTSLK